jgi:hypothetical protein
VILGVARPRDDGPWLDNSHRLLDRVRLGLIGDLRRHEDRSRWDSGPKLIQRAIAYLKDYKRGDPLEIVDDNWQRQAEPASRHRRRNAMAGSCRALIVAPGSATVEAAGWGVHLPLATGLD